MELTFTEAILDATKSIMLNDEKTILFGLGVNDDRGLQGTTKGLCELFGQDRVFDIPIAEDAMMGFAVGAAVSGVRTIFNHARMDFVLLTFNQLFNVATKYHYMFNGAYSVPVIVRCLVGFGWGAQHSQVLTSVLSSFPGISVVCPSNPREAKGLMMKASKVNYPVVFVEDFQLYSTKCDVDEEDFEVDFDYIRPLSSGSDITLVTLSSSVLAVERYLKSNKDISVDAYCLMSPTDYNKKIISDSVKKTKKIIFVQNAWMPFGLGANIVRELSLQHIDFKYEEVGFPFTPTPFSKNLEAHYYVSEKAISETVYSLAKKQ